MRETLDFGYDWNSQLEIYGGTSASQVQSTNNSQTTSNNGFDEVRAGGRYWLNLQGFDLVPQFDFVYPFFRVDTGSSDPLVGEGAMKVRAGGWAMRAFGEFQAFGYLGFEYRDEGRASLMDYAIGGQFQPNSFWVSAQLRGYSSITNDSNMSNQALRDTYLATADAGSYRFYGINPNLMEGEVEAGFKYQGWNPYVGFAQTFTGSSTAAGWTGLVGVRFNPPPVLLPAERDQFTEPAESYDNSVFERANPTVQQPQAKPQPHRQIRRRRPVQPSDQSVDDLMNQTEKELENK